MSHTKFADAENLAFGHRIEYRTWYADGRYLGDRAPWVEDTDNHVARALTGDFYGEWSGTRHFDGFAIMAADIERAKENRRTGASNYSPNSDSGKWYREGECIDSRRCLGDWGECRIVTFPVEHAAA